MKTNIEDAEALERAAKVASIEHDHAHAEQLRPRAQAEGMTNTMLDDIEQALAIGNRNTVIWDRAKAAVNALRAQLAQRDARIAELAAERWNFLGLLSEAKSIINDTIIALPVLSTTLRAASLVGSDIADKMLDRAQSFYKKLSDGHDAALASAPKAETVAVRVSDDPMGWQIGQLVVKVTGDYHPPGSYRGFVRTEEGHVRLIVQHHYGMLHIYSPTQIHKADGPLPPAPRD